MVRIVGISDLHYAYDFNTLSGVDDIINNVSDIDIVVTHGDLAHCPLQPTSNPHEYDYDPERIYDDLGTMIDKIKQIPASEFYHAPGNHDPWHIYRRMFGRTYHIIEKSTFILAVLDDSMNYWFNAFPWKQIQELIDKARATNKAILAFVHCPPIALAGIGDRDDLFYAHYIYWVARNGKAVLDALDALGVKVVMLTGHIWPSDAGTTTYGTNITLGWKKHTWSGGTEPTIGGHTWIVDVDESARTMTISVFDHSTKTITQLTSISY